MNKKIYKGYELIKAIADGEIKEGSKFSTCRYGRVIVFKGKCLWYEEDNEEVCNSVIINNEFELIEDEINIEELLELREINVENVTTDEDLVKEINCVIARQNTMLQWAKQIDKKIKEKE